MATQDYCLPHTEITLDRGGVEVDGSLVYVEKTVIGEVEDSGWGGPVLFHSLTAGGRAVWEGLVAGARDQHGQPLDEETLADELLTEGRFERIVRRAAGDRSLYALRYITQLRFTEGGEELEAVQVREPHTIHLRRPVELAPIHVQGDALSKALSLPKNTLYADIHLEQGWTRFYTAPEVG